MTFFYELKLTFSNIGSEMNTASSSFSFLIYGCNIIRKILISLIFTTFLKVFRKGNKGKFYLLKSSELPDNADKRG